MTIARIWRGITLTANADCYLQYLEESIAPAYRSACGCDGFLILKEGQGELVHFLLLSFWTSKEALENFADHAPRQIVQPCPVENSPVITFEAIARCYEVVYAPESPVPEVKNA